MLLLIRHAATVHRPDLPPEDWRLDDRDPEALNRFRRRFPWQSVQQWFSSPEVKAVATARQLTDREIATVAGLRELGRSGWTDDYESMVARVFAEDAVPAQTGWESAEEARTRFDSSLRQVVASCSDGAVAVVTHGLVLHLWSSWVAQVPPSMSRWRTLGFPDALVMPDTSVRRWLSDDPRGVPELERLPEEENDLVVPPFHPPAP